MENEQKIEIQIDVRAEDYRRVLFWYNRSKIFALTAVLLLAVPFIIWFVVFVEGTSRIDSSQRNFFEIAIFYGMFALVPIFLAIILISIWTQSRKLAAISEVATFIFDDEGLKSNAKSTTTKSNWERFAKICETKTDFIFFPQENIFYPIPKRFFQNNKQIRNFKNLIREKLGKKAKLRS